MASDEMLMEALETLERAGCQGHYCNGPTLDPEPMVTCFVCVTIARCRRHLGLPPRRDDEETWQERYDREMSDYMAKATHRR